MPKFPLYRWIWRSYAKAALIPLLVIELALVGLYLGTNMLTRDQSVDSINTLAHEELSRIAFDTARIVDQQLASVAASADLWRRRVAAALKTPYDVPEAEKNRYGTNADGAYFTTYDIGGAAAFFSGLYPVGQAERDRLLRLSQLDGLMRDLLESQPLAAQVYFNTHDAANRIYPYFDVVSMYPPKMNLPGYNFYYEADADHNPRRDVVWTDVYIDPAGQGWMTSAIAPVYDMDFMEGVAGIDVLVKDAVSLVEGLRIPWDGYALLVSKNNTIMALPRPAEAEWGLRELTDHSYAEAIREDTFKPDRFNLSKRADTAHLAAAMEADAQDILHMEWGGENKLVAWATIPEAGWKLLVLVPEQRVHAAADRWAERFNLIGIIAIGMMILFYIGFFMLLQRRAHQMAHRVAAPLAILNTIAARIGEGAYTQQRPSFPILELDETGDRLVEMGRRLADTTQEVVTAKDRLQRQADEFDRLIQTLPMPVFQMDAEKRVSLCNSAFRRFFAREGDALLGTKIFDHIPEEALYAGTEPVRDLTLRNSSGALHDMELLLAEPDARFGGRIGVLIDVTDRKLTEAAMRQARDRAMEASRLKNRFLSAISTEFLTPMNGVIGMADLLADTQLDDRQQKYLADLRSSGDRLWELITDLLDYTQLQSGTLRPSASDVGLDDLVKELTALMRDGATAKGLSAATETAFCGVDRIITDRELVVRAVRRLLDNAIKFTREGGVTLQVRVLPADPGGEAWLELAVRDTGPGIAMIDRKRIFDAFIQVENGPHGVETGCGIGLSLAKGLTTLLAGKIGLDEKVTVGARFWVRIPIRPA